MPTTTTPLLDTSVMPVLHSFYRREFRLAGGLVRAVQEGDLARAATVADHLDLISASLHHHHTVEDEMLWPLLLERVPDEMAPLVHLMESQHARVHALQQQIDETLRAFRASASPADGERLATLLDELYVHLVEHLDAEEQRMLPIVARTITTAEWDAMGEAGRSATPREHRLLVLGMFQHDGDPNGFAGILGSAPPPVRWLLPKLARRAFRSYALRVHGTASP